MKPLGMASPRLRRPSAAAARDEPTLQVEALLDIARELPPLFVRYGREFAKIEGVISDPDWQQMFRMAAAGMLRVVTVRDSGVLVGFAFNIVGPHLMYRSVIHGITNAVWLDKAYRVGWFPLKFLRFNRDKLIEWGCKRLCIGHDLTWDRLGKVYERLGYKLDEILYVQGVS